MTDWEKRAKELFPWEDERGFSAHRVAAIKMANEMADERAEEIARHADSHVNAQVICDQVTRTFCASVARDIAHFARSFISKKRTREQVLEEALRVLLPAAKLAGVRCDPIDGAIRALEWREGDK